MSSANQLTSPQFAVITMPSVWPLHVLNVVQKRAGIHPGHNDANAGFARIVLIV